MDNFDVGGTITTTFAVKTAAGVLVDADVLTLIFQAGSAGALVDKSADVVRDSAGTYHCDFDVEIATEPTDPYRYTWRSTGAVRAVAGGRFMSRPVDP